MSHKHPIDTIYTYADNRAIGFFEKAGFVRLHPLGIKKIKPKITTYFEARLMKFDMCNY